MANASNKHFGPGGNRGKGDGSGATTTLRPEDLPENAVLSNRDKKQGSDERGQDGQWIAQQQKYETEANKREG